MEPTGEAPTPSGSRSNYDLNVFSVREDELADPVMPGGAASGGASASGQRAVQNYRRAELFEAEANQSLQLIPKFYTLKFNEAQCRTINPYAVQETLTKVCGVAPDRLETEGKSAYCIKVNTKAQAIKLQGVTEVDGKSCHVEPHSHRNSSKGLIFIKEFDVCDVAPLKDYLREFNVIGVEPAPFIKTKSITTKAFIITFSTPKTPYSIYIPGERSDTQVQPFRNRPMMCQKCLSYGHTQKRCRSEVACCRRCSSRDHVEADCGVSTPKCFHCEGEHPAGSRDCPHWRREQEVINLSDEHKVTYQRARQMMENNTVNASITKTKIVFPTYFDIKFDSPQLKRNISPFLLEKCIQAKIGNKPRTIRTKDSTTFTIQVSKKEESISLSKIDSINGTPVTVTLNDSADISKGLIYIYEYDMTDFDSFKAGLMNRHGLVNVEEAVWVKPRRGSNVKPLMLSFRTAIPDYIDVPGERMRTKVYEYIKKPLLCGKCLDYGHSKKVCQGTTKCKNCAADEIHENCTNDKRCYHCSLNHEAGNKICQEYKYEAEILAVQAKSRPSRQQARLIFMRENPTFRTLNFANAVKSNTSSTLPSSNTPSSMTSSITPPNSSSPTTISPTTLSTTTLSPSTLSPTTLSHTTLSPTLVSSKTPSSKPLSSKPSSSKTKSFKTPSSKTLPLDTSSYTPSTKTSSVTAVTSDASNWEILKDHEKTSENNPVVRAESRRFYDEFDSDILTYEQELKDSNRTKSNTTLPRRSRSRERSKRNNRSYSKSRPRRHSRSRSKSRSRSRPRQNRPK